MGLQNTYRTIEVKPLSGVVGAEIFGADLSTEIDEDQFSEIRAAFHAHGVIFFREQELDPEQHIAFARRWGNVNVNRFFQLVEAYPLIAEVRKEPHHEHNIGGHWHTDHSYDLARRSARCSTRATTQDAVHPVVIRHPETRRESLYVNPDFTVRFEGWTDEESAPLLDFLYRHGARPEFTCRFRWRRGSLALWDNRATWHYALNDYPGQRRYMHRITVEGTPLGR